MGAAITPTGILALANASIAVSRARGKAALGSRRGVNDESSVVIERFTAAPWYPAISRSTSISLVTNTFLVMIATGFLKACKTSRQRRVIFNFRSIG